MGHCPLLQRVRGARNVTAKLSKQQAGSSSRGAVGNQEGGGIG